MRRQGLVHIDWIISFFIFFLYLSFMFLFLNPIRIVDNTGGQLLNIVENGVRQEIYWNVTKVPLLIDSSDTGFKAICLELFPFDWIDGSIAFFDDNRVKIPFSLTGSSPEGNCQLIYNYNFISKNIFWITYGPGASVGQNTGCGASDPCDDFLLSTRYTYTYGLPEFISGVSKNKLDALGTLSQAEYDGLKLKFGLPVKNNFKVEIWDVTRTSLKYLFEHPNPDQVNPGNENVYVREWGDRLLREDASSESVIVSVKAW